MSRLQVVFALLFSAVLLGGSAFAVDGTVLINQNTAVNGLPGCGSSGFPIVICQTGSYKLASNLVLPGTTDAIDITADNVTLDMNGFSIIGSVTCSSGNCSGYGIGVNNDSIRTTNGLTLRNGTIRGMFDGVWVAGSNLIEEVVAMGNAYTGMQLSYAVVRRSRAVNNGYNGMDCGGGGCVLTDNLATGNAKKGLVAFDSTVTGNVSNRNGEAGIYAGNSVLNGNTFNGNPTAIENNGDLVSLSNNHCSGAPCQ